MDKIYKHWNDQGILEKYGKIRKWDERFKSETYFFEKVFKPGMSVLDVGCATGELFHGLKERFGAVKYTGIDVADKLIDQAGKWTDEAEFITGNILEGDLADRKFDITTATGVFQHEPASEKLLEKMLNHTKDEGCIIFDIKLFHSHQTLKDINKSYCDHPEPIYFIVFNFWDFMNWMMNLKSISEIHFFGYYSGVNKSVRLPEDITEEVCSSHVMVKKGELSDKKQIRLDLNLPHDFIKSLHK